MAHLRDQVPAGTTLAINTFLGDRHANFGASTMDGPADCGKPLTFSTGGTYTIRVYQGSTIIADGSLVVGGTGPGG